MILKVLGNSVSFTTANTVSDSTLVRLYAAAASNVTISGTVNGGFTMGAGTSEIIEKAATDTVTGSTTLIATPIAYRH